MDRERQPGDRCGGDYSDSHRNSQSATSSWSSDDPTPRYDRNFDTQRCGFSSDGHQNHRHHYHHRYHQPSNHRHHYNFNTEQNDSSGGSGGDIGSGHSLSLSARKRPFTYSGPSYGASSDCVDGSSYVKLYVGGIPRTSSEEEIRSFFEEYGNIVEVVRLKDKRTGLLQECCFVKYARLEEAVRAIGALRNQCTFPGGAVPLKVRYADGERERIGGFRAQECKLYVGCLNKQASKKEIEEIFSDYGLVEEVYIVRDELKQSRGCGFIQFSHRDMAVAAMNALNGTYVMQGCEQPLIVRFADPKKPRIGDSRDNCKFRDSSIGSCFQEPVVRPVPHRNDPVADDVLPNASHPHSPKTMTSSSHSPQTRGKPQIVSSTHTAPELVLPSSTSSAPSFPTSTQMADSLDSDWSEHTCPDGYKYYYNCVTCESRWEKPEEYSIFEQQLKKQQEQQRQQHSSCQHVHSPSNPQVLSTQEVS